MTKTAYEKEVNLRHILSTASFSANEIQAQLKGSEYAMRRQTIQQITKQITVTEPSLVIQNDKSLAQDTKNKLINVIKTNHKQGKTWKTRDMMRTIYNPDRQGKHRISG